MNLTTNNTNQLQQIIDEYVSKFPDKSEAIIGTVETISKTATFKALLETDKDGANALLRSNLDYITLRTKTPPISTYGNDGGKYYADYPVPTVKQSTAYNCALAAALQAIIGNGDIPNTKANRSAEKQAELAELMGYDATSGEGLGAGRTRDLMNEFSAVEYKAVNVTEYDVEDVKLDLRDSLKNGYCPIIITTDTSKLEYYGEYVCGHAMTVSEIDGTNYTIIDPFNVTTVGSGLKSFGGRHTGIPEEDVIAALGINVDGWVIMPANHTDWAAV